MADENMSNFLATDKVPDTIFGIPIVSRREDYTERDIEFFKEHPEAGGYYDMGDEAEESAGAWGGGDTLDRIIGTVGKAIDRGIAASERGLAKAADWGEGTAVGAIASAVIPAAVGIRAINANLTSGHGSRFTTAVRDERYFPQSALRNLAQNLDENGGKGTQRYASTGLDSTGAWVASQAVGGSTVENGKLTDVFDINDKYRVFEDLKDTGVGVAANARQGNYGLAAASAATSALGHTLAGANTMAGALFGSSVDRDEGKVRTEIPLSALEKYRTRQAAKGGVSFASIFGPEGLKNLVKAGWKNLPSLVDTPFEAGGKTFQIGELKDVTMRKGWETALMRKSKTLADLLDFSSPQGKRLLAAYPGIDRTVVENESRPDKPGQKKSYKDVSGTFARGEDGAPDVIWLNPDHADYRQKSSAYNTVLHEGINHAIWAREPSFPRRVIPYGDLSNFGYATDLEEAIVDLASNRGEARASSGRGSANPAALASGVVPHIVARVASASDDDGSVSKRQPDSRMLKKGAK